MDQKSTGFERTGVGARVEKTLVIEAMAERGKEIILDIMRQEGRGGAPYRQRHAYAPQEDSETVATALRRINEGLAERGEPSIRWECSCLQKKCGACAMRINGRPCLACDYRLDTVAAGEVLSIEPLRKFPVVADLCVDRSILAATLRDAGVWLEDAKIGAVDGQDAGACRTGESDEATLYESARCLQCGCCLEICPNYDVEGGFAGAAAIVPMAGLIEELPRQQRKAAYRQYRTRVYEGCGKALSCRDICPAGIDTEALLVRASARAIWGRRPGRRGREAR